MELIDTHTHLYLDSFDADRDEVIRRAMEKGVKAFYLPNIDRTSIDAMLALEASYPGRCFAMMGLHPCSVKEDVEEQLQVVKDWLDRRPFSAIGEIGIDLYWDKTFAGQQKEAFLTQVEWAKSMELPVVIHSRDALDLIISLLQEIKDDRLRGIFHCFSGTADQARAVIDLGFLMGIGGVLTFKKAGLDKVLEEIALEYLVLETDSPYLAPVPFRGKRNESSYLYYVAEKLAEIKGLSLEEVSGITTRNAENLFASVPKEAI